MADRTSWPSVEPLLCSAVLVNEVHAVVSAHTTMKFGRVLLCVANAATNALFHGRDDPRD